MWNYFEIFAYLGLLFLAISFFAAIFQYKKEKLVLSTIFGLGACALLAVFIASLWIHVERPPLRTLAETRLWYSFFLSLIGYFAYKLLKLRWFWLYAMAMSALFLSINLAKPETFDKSLMPALQSVWFVPHVVVYIIAYAFLAGSSAGAVYAIWMRVRGKKEDTILGDLDVIVYAGFGFLTLGLIFGALWAKTAWGHYWTWDPKETWALMTWLMYLLYIHIRVQHKSRVGLQQWMLALSCIVLMLCWFGVNYLPSTQNSIHVYSQE